MSRPDWSEHGGPTSHLPLLIEQLEKHEEIDLRCFCYGNRQWGGLPQSLCQTLPLRLWITCADLVTFLLMILRLGRPQVVHLNSTYERLSMLRDLPYLTICRFLRIRSLVKTHGSDESLLKPLSRTFSCIRTLYARMAQVITFLSPVETQQFRTAFPESAKKFHTAKNIVVPRRSDASKHQPERILFAGRFAEKKNIPALLEGFALIKDEFPHASLTLAGSGSLEPLLRRDAERLGISSRLIWTGWVDRETLRALNDQCPVVVFTSTGLEGMPMILLEALSSRSTLVSSSVRFTRSYPINALGVVELAGTSAHDIAEGMRRALREPAVSDTTIERRNSFFRQFSAETVRDEFLKLYSLTGDVSPYCDGE